MVTSDWSELRMRWGRQYSDAWICEVGPASTTYPGRSLRECADAASTLLHAGEPVDWVPGDGTNYQLALFRSRGSRWLAFTNASFPGLLRLRNGGLNVADYVRSSAPQGGWSGLRPLLGVLCHERAWIGNKLVSPSVEAEERAKQHRTQPMRDGDAELGRQVRLLVEAER